MQTKARNKQKQTKTKSNYSQKLVATIKKHAMQADIETQPGS